MGGVGRDSAVQSHSMGGVGGGEEGHTHTHTHTHTRTHTGTHTGTHTHTQDRTRKCCTYPLATYPASFFLSAPLCWPPLFLPCPRYLFAPFSNQKVLYSVEQSAQHRAWRGRFRKNISTKFGKEIPSRNLRTRRSNWSFQKQLAYGWSGMICHDVVSMLVVLALCAPW